jgi:hypothetical protein
VTGRAGRRTVRPCLLGILAAAISLLLSGCWTNGDVNHLALVFALGIDRQGAGVAVTASVGEIQVGQSGGMFGGGSWAQLGMNTLTAEAPTITGAAARLSTEAAGSLYLGSLRLLVVGAPLARAGVADTMAHLMRRPDVAKDVGVIGALPTARAVLTARFPGGLPGATFLFRNAEYATRTATTAAPVQLDTLFSQAYSPSQVPALPLYGSHPPGPDAVALRAGDRVAAVVNHQAAVFAAAAEHADPGDWAAVRLLPGQPAAILRLLGLRARGHLSRHGAEATVTLTGRVLLGGAAPTTMLGHDTPRLARRVNVALARIALSTFTALYADGVDVLDLGVKRPGVMAESTPTAAWRSAMRHLRLTVRAALTVQEGGPYAT